MAIRIVIFILSVSLAMTASTNQKRSSQPADKKTESISAKQRQGVALLESAEAESSNLRGGMRVWALLEIARGYSSIDKEKAVDLLQTALEGSRELLDDENASSRLSAPLWTNQHPLTARARLQEQILEQLISLDPNRAMEVLPQVDKVSRAIALKSLITYYEKCNRLDDAIRLVYSIGSDGEIPYATASHLMGVLKPSQSAEFIQLFVASANSYHDNGPHFASIDFVADDFANMVVLHWRRLPQRLVLNAIDEILEQEQQVEKASNGFKVTGTSLFSEKGSVSFSSTYERRIFQFAPVLREIDPPAAEEYLKKYPRVGRETSKYPGGENDLASEPSKADQQGYSSGRSFASAGDSASLTSRLAELPTVQRCVTEAMAGKGDDALATIPVLNDPGVQAQCYSAIAQSMFKKDVRVALKALAKLVDISEKLQNRERLEYLRSAAELYRGFGEEDSAKRAIEKGLGVADQLYRTDSNPDNPNRALKAYWATTDGYCSLLRLAGRISLPWAIAVSDTISDPDIKVAAKIALADQVLGIPAAKGTIMTMDSRGSGAQLNF